jgi:hypothetical protein
VAPTGILILMLVVIFVPGIVLLAIGGREERPSGDPDRVPPAGAEGELPELLRRPLRGGTAL